MLKKSIYIVTFLCVLVIVVWLVVDNQKPHIKTLEVSYTYQGVAQITGKNFGKTPGTVLLNSQALDQSDILFWNTDTVRFVVPEQFATGLLFVDNGRGKSNALLFLRSEAIAQAPQENELVLEPSVVRIGELLRIELPFDLAIETLEFVCFDSEDMPYPLDPMYIEYSVDNTVLIQVPDYDLHSVHIRTPQRTFIKPIDLIPVESVEYSEPRSYFLSQTVLVSKEQLRVPRSMMLIPRIHDSPPLQSVQYTAANPLPVLHYVSTPLRKALGIRLTRHRAVWNFEQADFEQNYTHRFTQRYLAPIQLDESQQLLVNALVQNLSKQSLSSVLQLYSRVDANFIDENELSPTEAATLVLSVLRRLGIPAKLVQGYVQQGSLLPHAWVHFFVLGLGWVPIDPLYAQIYKLDDANTEEETIFYTSNTHIALEEYTVPVEFLNRDQGHLAQLFPPTKQVYPANGRFFFVAEQRIPDFLTKDS